MSRARELARIKRAIQADDMRAIVEYEAKCPDCGRTHVAKSQYRSRVEKGVEVCVDCLFERCSA